MTINTQGALDDLMKNRLSEEDRLEYQRLKGIEDLAKALGKEVPIDVIEKLKQFEKKILLENEGPKHKEEPVLDFDVPQELQNFRQLRKEKIQRIDGKIKENIIQASEQIPVKVEKDIDGNKLIEFNLSGKKYKILDVNLKIHSDPQYYNEKNYNSINYSSVSSEGMMGSEVENWENKKLKEFVKEQESKGWHMPKNKEMETILQGLGKKADLVNESDQIAMLMYLTGMDGWYRLSSIYGEESRYKLICNVDSRNIDFFTRANNAGFCMIACE